MRQYISPALNRKPQTSRVVLAGDLGQSRGRRRYRPTGMGICFKITAAVFSARMSQFGSDGLLNTFTLTKASAAPRPVKCNYCYSGTHNHPSIYTHRSIPYQIWDIPHDISTARLCFVSREQVLCFMCRALEWGEKKKTSDLPPAEVNSHTSYRD